MKNLIASIAVLVLAASSSPAEPTSISRDTAVDIFAALEGLRCGVTQSIPDPIAGSINPTIFVQHADVLPDGRIRFSFKDVEVLVKLLRRKELHPEIFVTDKSGFSISNTTCSAFSTAEKLLDYRLGVNCAGKSYSFHCDDVDTSDRLPKR